MLAGGVAHDVNNPLAAVLAEAELATTELMTGECPLEGIQRIATIAIRGAEIVRALLIYLGHSNADPIERVDLSYLVEEMLQLLHVCISKGVVINSYLDQNLPAVVGRASQFRQIVMNLALNASEAIGETPGRIKIITSHISVQPDSIPHGPLHLLSGDYVKLEVSDTGCGMREEAQARIFDLRFTTNPRGHGLGLAVVKGIVRDHGGAINVVSKPGHGTRFEILLPCAG